MCRFLLFLHGFSTIHPIKNVKRTNQGRLSRVHRSVISLHCPARQHTYARGRYPCSGVSGKGEGFSPAFRWHQRSGHIPSRASALDTGLVRSLRIGSRTAFSVFSGEDVHVQRLQAVAYTSLQIDVEAIPVCRTARPPDPRDRNEYPRSRRKNGTVDPGWLSGRPLRIRWAGYLPEVLQDGRSHVIGLPGNGHPVHGGDVPNRLDGHEFRYRLGIFGRQLPILHPENPVPAPDSTARDERY